jgi:hypothetical protein
MSNVGNLEQQIASLQINHGNETKTVVKPGKKIGPAVPPKPKKSQPQVNPHNLEIIFSNLYVISLCIALIHIKH